MFFPSHLCQFIQVIYPVISVNGHLQSAFQFWCRMGYAVLGSMFEASNTSLVFCGLLVTSRGMSVCYNQQLYSWWQHFLVCLLLQPALQAEKFILNWSSHHSLTITFQRSTAYGMFKKQGQTFRVSASRAFQDRKPASSLVNGSRKLHSSQCRRENNQASFCCSLGMV